MSAPSIVASVVMETSKKLLERRRELFIELREIDNYFQAVASQYGIRIPDEVEETPLSKLKPPVPVPEKKTEKKRFVVAAERTENDSYKICFDNNTSHTISKEAITAISYGLKQENPNQPFNVTEFCKKVSYSYPTVCVVVALLEFKGIIKRVDGCIQFTKPIVNTPNQPAVECIDVVQTVEQKTLLKEAERGFAPSTRGDGR